MKYCVLVCDGMADTPIDALGGKTPMEAADKPEMDTLCRTALAGMASNVPVGMVPESDTANLAILSYDPAVYSRGRSPLEALSMGLSMTPEQTAFRCNVVTLSEEDGPYENRTMLDHSADEITTAEADVLIAALNEAMGDELRHFYTGVSYRHCLLWSHAPEFRDFARPHDILDQKITGYLPPEPFLSLYRRSYEILEHHPVNEARRARGLRPANSMWLWSPGKKPQLPSFRDKWGMEAAVISAVDLIKGIGLCAGMEVVNVEGATGNVNTNYEGKAQAAISAFGRGCDFVFIHVEAPDECGHRAETDNKVRAISFIDQRILRPVYEYLAECGEPFKIMVLPDHPTPIAKRTHTMDPVPFFIYSSDAVLPGIPSFSEAECEKTGLYVAHGYRLLELMFS